MIPKGLPAGPQPRMETGRESGLWAVPWCRIDACLGVQETIEEMAMKESSERTYQLPFPPPLFLIFLGSSPT